MSNVSEIEEIKIEINELKNNLKNNPNDEFLKKSIIQLRDKENLLLKQSLGNYIN